MYKIKGARSFEGIAERKKQHIAHIKTTVGR